MPKQKSDGCSFLLDKPKSELATMIIFQMYCPDGKVKRSIARKVLPAEWNFDTQRATGAGREVRETNRVIDSIIGMLPGLRSECQRTNRVMSCADVNAALDVLLQNKRKEKATQATGYVPGADMFKDFEKIIEGMKDGSTLTPGKHKKRYKPATIKSFEVRTKPKIEEFFKDRRLPSQWGIVTIEIYNDFISWCHGKDLSNNSIGVYVKCWKRMADIALNKGWHNNGVFAKKDFMILKEETPDIFLDETKIGAIYKQQVPAKHYDIARDWFIIGCYLGLRISDWGKIDPKEFTGKYFTLVNEKTGTTVAIPIHPHIKAIVKKWKGLPPAITGDKLNEYIKVVAKMAKLKKKFIYKITKGGELRVEELEEWQMVSSHTCRRSLITNLLKVKKPHPIPHAIIMKLVGIKRYETLMRYFKLSEQEAAEEAGEHDFFQ